MARRDQDQSLYDLMIELDRLEELREELEERGLRTIDEVSQRIEELGAKIETVESDEASTE